MEYRNLGSSGLQVSAIGLGTTNFGRRDMGLAESTTVVHEAVDAGINLIDTANTYGPAEEYVGKACRGMRDRVIIATKVSSPVGTGPNRQGASRAHVLEQLHRSLKRLRTDYVDLYQLHVPDPQTPLQETLSVLDELVRDGKVRYIGCSNFAAWQVARAVETSGTFGLERMISTQSEYNVLSRAAERELVPCCLEYGVGIMAYHPLDSGFLTGKYRKGQPPPDQSRLFHVPSIADRLLTDPRFALAERLEAFAAERGHSLLELAIGWLLSRPAVDCAIIGASRKGQAAANVAASGWILSADEIRAIDELVVSTG
jgi:aryl-alcohol dehydrogenase-like predicted oxidoreductase